MYYFEKLNLNFKGEKPNFAGDFGHDLANVFGECEKSKLLEIIKIGAKFKRQLFDDYSFYCGEKTKPEADFECAMRIIEIAYEASNSGNFYVVRAQNGEIAGFWYLYDVNYIRTYERKNSAGREVKTPVVGVLAGCLKKEFWGGQAREIMRGIIKEIFCVRRFRKIKCETFSTNPYIERFLKEFDFRLEGVLKNETQAAGRLADVKIWGLECSWRNFLQRKRG